MKIKGVIDEDFVNYKKPSMVIMCHSCSFKCDKECGEQVCQNSTLANIPDIEVSELEIVKRYINNSITKAVVFGGLEPFDSIFSVLRIIERLRYQCIRDDIIIYTGYTEGEIKTMFAKAWVRLRKAGNVILKYGRYIPNQKPHYDGILGINLASDNQYAVRL